MSYAPNLAAGFTSSKSKGGQTRTYIDSNGDLVEEGNGQFLGARLAGGEGFVSSSEDEGASTPEYYPSGHKEKKKSKKHRKEAAFDPSMHASSAVMGQREYSLGHEASSSKKKRSKDRLDAVPRTAGGCCGGCQHAQQPAPQQMHQHYAQHPGMMAGPVQGNYGYPGGPAPQGYGNQRSYH